MSGSTTPRRREIVSRRPAAHPIGTNTARYGNRRARRRSRDRVRRPASLDSVARVCRTFADVVGQEHVVRTLSNAVTQDKVHHAYLFVGSRGTGKTSMAKILAACLNCESGPTIEPCGRCDSCVAIASATSLDFTERAPPPNTPADDTRELREWGRSARVSGR